jgi:hypothetical protein
MPPETLQSLSTRLARRRDRKAPLSGDRFFRQPVVTGLVVLLIGALAATVVQAPYRDAAFVLDSIYYNVELGLIRTHGGSWPAFLVGVHGGYLHPLWKVQYALMLDALGSNPAAWHAVITTVHVLTAALLFILVLRYTASLAAAAVTALAWAGAAIGKYDNPLLCISSSEQVMALAWLLVAMLCAAGFRRPASIPLALLMFISAAAAVLTWGLALLLLPVIALQLVLFEDWPHAPRATKWLWASLWIVLMAILGLIQLAVTAFGPSDFAGRPSLVVFLRHFAAPLVGSLASLLGAQSANVQTALVLLGALLLAAAIACGIPRQAATVGLSNSPPSRAIAASSTRWLLIAAWLALPYCALVAGLRTDRDVDDGRYFFLPTLFWCAIWGSLAGRLTSLRWRWLRWTAVALVVLALPGYVFVQRRVAVAAREEFNALLRHTFETVADFRSVLLAMSEKAGREHLVLRFPNIPLVIPPDAFPVMHPLSAFIAIQFPHGLPNVRTLQPDRLTADELRLARSFLHEVPSQAARDWERTIDTTLPAYQHVTWLAGYAQRTGERIVLPDFDFEDQQLGLRVPLSLFVIRGFEPPLAGIQVLRDPPPADMERTIVLLQSAREREAQWWLAQLRQVER